MTISVLSVAKGAEIIVPANMKLTFEGTSYEYTNSGRILVGGTFSAKNVYSYLGGLVENNGGTSEILWAEDANAEEAKKNAENNYKAALVEAVKYWANDERTLSLTVNNLNWNIKDGKTNAGVTAKELFVKYYDANSSVDAMQRLTTAFNNYNYYNSNASITDAYDYAVEQVVEGNTAAVKALKLVWQAPSDESEGEKRIYDNAAAALAGFKAAFANGEINEFGTILNVVTMCSGDVNYAPACSQVLRTDLVYTIFGTDAIRYCDDWKKAGFTYSYIQTSTWSLHLVNGWISEVAASDADNLYVRQAKKFVEDNNVISVSKSWTYDDNIIKAIAAEQFAK